MADEEDVVLTFKSCLLRQLQLNYCWCCIKTTSTRMSIELVASV